MLASMITIFSLGLEPPTQHIYEQKQSYQQVVIASKSDAHLPSFVEWQGTPQFFTASPQESQTLTKEFNSNILKEFETIGLSSKEGIALFNRASEILAEEMYPCTSVIPVIANDPEEEVSYLTLRLYVNASMEKAFELDSMLTRGLISSFAKLPVRLSFSVYENERVSV